MINTQSIIHQGKPYIVSTETPENGDLVLTNNYGVWEFRNDAPWSMKDKVCYAPLPYWANKNTCQKLIPN